MLKIDAGMKRDGDTHIKGYSPKAMPKHDIGSKRAGDTHYPHYDGANNHMKSMSHPESPKANPEAKEKKKMGTMSHPESPKDSPVSKEKKMLKSLSDPKKAGKGHPGAHEA